MPELGHPRMLGSFADFECPICEVSQIGNWHQDFLGEFSQVRVYVTWITQIILSEVPDL